MSNLKKKDTLESLKLGLKHQESVSSHHYWYHVSISGFGQPSHHLSSFDAAT